MQNKMVLHYPIQLRKISFLQEIKQNGRHQDGRFCFYCNRDKRRHLLKQLLPNQLYLRIIHIAVQRPANCRSAFIAKSGTIIGDG